MSLSWFYLPHRRFFLYNYIIFIFNFVATLNATDIHVSKTFVVYTVFTSYFCINYDKCTFFLCSWMLCSKRKQKKVWKTTKWPWTSSKCTVLFYVHSLIFLYGYEPKNDQYLVQFSYNFRKQWINKRSRLRLLKVKV